VLLERVVLFDTSLRPSENWADVGELRLRFLDWGGQGHPVLALHGLASSAHWYDLVAPMLRDQYRVIAPDQRGHGQTTQADHGYDWQSLASDAAGLLDYLGISRAAVLGHSWGCNVAINLAARFPQRISALAMIDGGLGGGRARQTLSWEEFRERARPRDVSGTRQQFLERLRQQLWFCWNDEVERIVQTMVREDDLGQIQDILRPENHAQVMKAMYDEPPSTVWNQVKCPTLLIPAGPRSERAGTENARIKEERVNASVEGIENCRVCWIPETVHDIGYDKPQVLAQVILEFLAECQMPPSSRIGLESPGRPLD
jgi:pimeloyl-ACP methyl ester carboxylesterase